jgi:hypothetical protein
MNGTGTLPEETRRYVSAITGDSVEQWVHAPDRKIAVSNHSCPDLMVAAKGSPEPFVDALRDRILTGSRQPWSVIMAAGFSRTRILQKYADLRTAHPSTFAEHDAYLAQVRIYTRGRMPFYQVRIGLPDRKQASEVCSRIEREHGACMLLRNPSIGGRANY